MGRERICFGNKKGNHVYVQPRLEEEYPKLVNLEDVFQLFRALRGESVVRELTKIPIGSCGYTIPWLRFDCSISSCCVYVVPCQMELSVEPKIKAVTVTIV